MAAPPPAPPPAPVARASVRFVTAAGTRTAAPSRCVKIRRSAFLSPLPGVGSSRIESRMVALADAVARATQREPFSASTQVRFVNPGLTRGRSPIRNPPSATRSTKVHPRPRVGGCATACSRLACGTFPRSVRSNAADADGADRCGSTRRRWPAAASVATQGRAAGTGARRARRSAYRSRPHVGASPRRIPAASRRTIWYLLPLMKSSQKMTCRSDRHGGRVRGAAGARNDRKPAGMPTPGGTTGNGALARSQVRRTAASLAHAIAGSVNPALRRHPRRFAVS